MSDHDSESSYQALIAECDQLIKTGRIAVVSTKLARIGLSQVPRKYRRDLAKICRRAGLITLGLRLLQPLVRTENHRAAPATDEEICEYAILLSRNGSVKEALNLLEVVKDSETPDALMSQTFCNMAHWEYEKVIHLLTKLLKTNADPYTKLIARVNLASAYLVTSQLDSAKELSTEAIEIATKTGASRLIANALEIRGQAYFQIGDFASARHDLDQARTCLGESKGYDHLFIQQWMSIIEAVEKKSVQPLIELRHQAVTQKLWESVREADLFTLSVNFDQTLLDRLMLGTPMPAYRKRIHTLIHGHQANDSYVFGDAKGPLLDMKSGEMNEAEGSNVDRKIHDVLRALLKDFYVPRNRGSLFAEIYPNEYFDINSSPLRLRQVLCRTRQWLKAKNVPATIDQCDGNYSLAVHGSFGFKVHLDNTKSLSLSSKWYALQKTFSSDASFTAKEACLKLGFSRTAFLVMAEQAILSGHLQKSGIGKQTVYKISNSLKHSVSKSAA